MNKQNKAFEIIFHDYWDVRSKKITVTIKAQSPNEASAVLQKISGFGTATVIKKIRAVNNE